MSNTETYERITATILSLVEKTDLLPWQRPWRASSEFARSMSSGKAYNGANRWVLTLTAQANGWSPWFGTYKQIEKLGGQVRKGEKSTTAVLWKPMTKIVDGVEEKFLLLRTFNVFSASQADGLPEKYYAKPEPGDFTDDAEAENVFDAYIQREGISVKWGGDRAAYNPQFDWMSLPEKTSFNSSEEYYSTAFHEAAHSTGHKSRLNRPDINNFHHFGDEMYSREELVAELTSALICGVLGLDKPNLVANQAAYLKSWRSFLTNDPQALIWAASRAEKAADFILVADEAEETPEEES